MTKYKTVDVSIIKAGRVVVLDTYWLCKNGNPSEAVYYGESAQCNAHKSIADRFVNMTSEKTGWNLEVVFIPVAYRPNTTWRDH